MNRENTSDANDKLILRWELKWPFATTPPTTPPPTPPMENSFHPFDLVPIPPHRSPNINIPFRHISTVNYGELVEYIENGTARVCEQAKNEVERRIDFFLNNHLKDDDEAAHSLQEYRRGKAPLKQVVKTVTTKLTTHHNYGVVHSSSRL